MMSSPPVRAWPPMPTARSVRTSSSALLSSSFSNANPRGGGQAGARRARRAGRAPRREKAGAREAWETEKGTMDMGGSRAAAEETREGESWLSSVVVFSTDKNRLAVRETACTKTHRSRANRESSFRQQRCARASHRGTHTGRVASVSRRSDRSRTQSPDEPARLVSLRTRCARHRSQWSDLRRAGDLLEGTEPPS